MAQVSPLSNFCRAFRRAVGYSWQQFWWRHQHENAQGVIDDELNAELRWAQQRKLSMAYEKKPLTWTDPDKDESWDDLVPQIDRGGPFYRALTKYEVENLLEYSYMYPGQAYQLNQSASEHAQCSNRQYLHTLIRNCGLIFTESAQPPRWLCATEMWLGSLLLLQPSTPSLFAGLG